MSVGHERLKKMPKMLTDAVRAFIYLYAFFLDNRMSESDWTMSTGRDFNTSVILCASFLVFHVYLYESHLN